MYLLLNRFESLFNGVRYIQRKSTQGDSVAALFYEDILSLDPTSKLVRRLRDQTRVMSGKNTRRGVVARRGDGTLGEIIPNTPALVEPGFNVARGELATVELGLEVKILATAMLKQIDRVIGDLIKQVEQFRKGGGSPICLGIVGVNHADEYTNYEGDRVFRTGERGRRHPSQEAQQATQRLQLLAAPHFDQFLILPFSATNKAPYPFKWIDSSGTQRDYGAVLTRVLRTYDQRF